MSKLLVKTREGGWINPEYLVAVEPPDKDGWCKFRLAASGMIPHHIHVRDVHSLVGGIQSANEDFYEEAQNTASKEIVLHRCTDCVHMPEVVGRMCLVGHYHATRHRRKCTEFSPK